MNKYFIFLSLYLAINFETCFGGLYCDRFNIMKSNIANLLNPGSTRSRFADGMTNLVSSVTNAADKTTLTNWITEVENNIIQNAAVTPAQTKLSKLATELDILFVQNPQIQKEILPLNISGWGPVCNFQYITDEDNIDYFWELSSTPGASGCKIYDILLDLTKDNPAVQKRLYLQGIPCSVSYGMVTKMVNMIYDVTEDQRKYLLTLTLPNGISFHQYIRIALAYYPTTLPTCDRILKINANFPYGDITLTSKNHMKTLLTYFQGQFTPDKNATDCFKIVDDRLTQYLDLSSSFMNPYLRTSWEPPFGTFFDYLIFNQCQIAILKAKAPAYYP